ncbi:MAG: ImmA/IrrE family metallo-endopeptidase [Aeromicrobium sp.]
MARAPIKGETLRWARSAGHVALEDLAKAAGTTSLRIEEFEDEVTEPTFRQLSLMAAKLDRPLGFFFAPAPSISDVPSAADFRGRADAEVPSDLAREMKRAEQHREVMLDLRGPVETSLDIDAVTWTSASQQAAKLRMQFGLTEMFSPPESQPNQVFNFWRGLLEAHGVLVFQATRISIETFRGLSIHHDQLPVILLNGADSASGRVFTLFHEVAHIVNRTSGLCLLDDDVNEEAVSNRFAADFLMPSRVVRGTVDSDAEPSRMATQVASMFKVSVLAAAVRLRSLDLIDEEALAAIRLESEDAWQRVRERQRESEGFVPPWRLRYRDLGSNYIGAVAAALEDRRIDAVDATYLLNARLPMVEQLLEEFYRTGGDA